jgi:tetratricopeptide (TPR) repeat protein
MLMLLLLMTQIKDPKNEAIDQVLSTAMMRSYKEAVWRLKNEQGQDPYQFGMDLAQKAHRPRAAVTWFHGLLNDIGDDESFRFGLAWSYWLDADHQGAMKHGARLLASKDPLIQARAESLMGQIYGRLDKGDKAIKHFRLAVEHYRNQKRWAGVFTNSLYLAKELIGKDRFDEARVQIAQAEQANLLLQEESKLPPKGFGQIFFTNCWLAYRQGLFREAAGWAERASRIYEEEGNYTSAVLNKISFSLCLAFTGDFLQAEKVADQVDNDLKRPGIAPYVAAYSNLAWMAINRCRGLDVETFEQPIRLWAKEHHDPTLQGMLDDVLKETCQ